MQILKTAKREFSILSNSTKEKMILWCFMTICLTFLMFVGTALYSVNVSQTIKVFDKGTQFLSTFETSTINIEKTVGEVNEVIEGINGTVEKIDATVERADTTVEKAGTAAKDIVVSTTNVKETTKEIKTIQESGGFLVKTDLNLEKNIPFVFSEMEKTISQIDGNINSNIKDIDAVLKENGKEIPLNFNKLLTEGGKTFNIEKYQTEEIKNVVNNTTTTQKKINCFETEAGVFIDSKYEIVEIYANNKKISDLKKGYKFFSLEEIGDATTLLLVPIEKGIKKEEETVTMQLNNR